MERQHSYHARIQGPSEASVNIVENETFLEKSRNFAGFGNSQKGNDVNLDKVCTGDEQGLCSSSFGLNGSELGINNFSDKGPCTLDDDPARPPLDSCTGNLGPILNLAQEFPDDNMADVWQLGSKYHTLAQRFQGVNCNMLTCALKSYFSTQTPWRHV